MKPLRWPSFVTGMFARYGCHVDLVVVTLDRKVAAWAARPIQIGRLPGGLTLTPTVIGPDQIPARLSPEQAHRMPELAVLSALAHAGGPDAAPIALTAVDALRELDSERQNFDYDLILRHLGPAARTLLEKLMRPANYEYQSDFARKYFFEGKAEGKAEGEAKGKAELLLRLIDSKGIAISEHDRQRVLTCTDIAQIESWFDRVLSASSRDEIFES